MTRLLEQVLAQVAQLPPDEQDALASRWLEELADDRKWDGAFASSQDALTRLAADVRAKVQAIGSHDEYDKLIARFR